MIEKTVTLSTGRIVLLPDETSAAIAQSAAKYSEPLWDYRPEKVLKLGGHQWIFPESSAAAQTAFTAHPYGISGLAWKLFNRGYLAHADAYYLDGVTYPNHPHEYGRNVIPLVDEDEDADSQQVGWVRIDSVSAADAQYAVFIQFTIVEMFAPRPLPAEYQ